MTHGFAERSPDADEQLPAAAQHRDSRSPGTQRPPGADLSAAAMLSLQRLAGNAAVGELLGARAGRSGPVVPPTRSIPSGRLTIQRQPAGDHDGGSAAAAPADAGPEPAPAPAAAGSAVQTAAPPPPPPPGPASAGGPDAGQPAAGTASAQLLQEVEVQRAAIHEAGDERRTRIAAAGAEHKAGVNQAVDAEATRLEGVYDTATQQIQAALTQARTEVTGQRDAQIAATRAAADAEIGRLQQTVADQQAAVTAAGEARAVAASEAGELEGRRAAGGGEERAVRADGIGDAKAAQYAGAREASKIAEIARRLASEVAARARSEGTKLGQSVSRTGSDLAAHFRSDAAEARAQFTRVLSSRTEKVTKARDAAVGRIGDLASETVTKLESSAADALDKINGTREDSLRQVRGLVAPGNAAIDQITEAATAQVGQATTALDGQLDQFAADATAQVDQAHGARTDQVLQALLAQLRQTQPEYTSAVDGLVGAAGGAMDQQVEEVRSVAASGVDSAAGPVQGAGGGFERSAADIAGKATQEMAKTASDATGDMRKTVDDTAADLRRATDQCDTRWAGELEDGRQEMRSEVDAGLARLDRMVSELGPKIDQEAADASSEGFWSSVGSFFANVGKFIGGVIIGLVEAVVELIVGIGKLLAAFVMALVHGNFLVWFLTIVVVALLVVIFIAGGWAAPVGLFVGALLLAAGIVLAVLGVIRMVEYLYRAFTTPGLSWYERGKLVGHAIFEGLMVVLIVAGWLKLARVGEAGEAGEAAGIGELSEALKATRAGLSDPAAISEFDAMFEELGKDSARMESAIDELRAGGDLEKELARQWQLRSQAAAGRWSKKPYGPPNYLGEIDELDNNPNVQFGPDYQAALDQNAQLIATRTAKPRADGSIPTQSLSNQLGRPRWRYLDRAPAARATLQSAIENLPDGPYRAGEPTRAQLLDQLRNPGNGPIGGGGGD